MSLNVSILKFYLLIKQYYSIEFQYGHIQRHLSDEMRPLDKLWHAVRKAE